MPSQLRLRSLQAGVPHAASRHARSAGDMSRALVLEPNTERHEAHEHRRFQRSDKDTVHSMFRCWDQFSGRTCMSLEARHPFVLAYFGCCCWHRSAVLRCVPYSFSTF